MDIIEMKKKGFAIILVLATLVLLAMLSLTYIKLALIDRNIARNYMDNKRAKLIAQSGVDYAIARIQEDIFDTSWQEAKTITINGENEKYTESAGSTYGENRDIFKVEVKDCNSMINVNDGLGNERVTANTKRILNVLGDVVGIATLGDRIINSRGQGYASKQELLKAISATELETIKELVTTHTWQDPNVANPVSLSSAVLTEYPVKYNQNIGVYRYGKGKDSSGQLLSGDLKYAPEFVDQAIFATPSAPFDLSGSSHVHGIYGLDELNPQWIEIVSRSPVNINLAKDEVLVALLKGLKGFFISDWRSNKLAWDYSAIKEYTSLKFNYAPGGSWCDEVGLLYSTEAILIDLAKELSAEIRRCRNSDLSYSSKWFRGPFRSWRQFNAFLDNHVYKEDLDPKIIKDSRTNIFREYEIFSLSTVPSSIALKIAHQAKADVLKANFNPNLHLNELNPDANIKTLVDKTNLIVNSTEFCFNPMGCFEIESEGLILKEQGSDNTVISRGKIKTVVKIFDVHRETNQKQFLAGDIPNSATNTNNGKTLEIGPEPGSVFSQQNEWSGYISLPTYEPAFGGPASSIETSPPAVTVEVLLDTPTKNKTTTITTTVITATNITTTTSSIHAHFKENFNATYHASGLTANLTTHNAPDRYKSDRNSADLDEAVAGPYVYNSRYKLCRSYQDKTGFDPIPFKYPPSDFRIDGAYLERHSGLAYSIDSNVFRDTGVACYWVKPSFYPEQTGKPRSFLSICDSDASLITTQTLHEKTMPPFFMFINFYIPAQMSNKEEPYYIDYWMSNDRKSVYRINSMIFGFTEKIVPIPGVTFLCSGMGQITPCLNHNYHVHPDDGYQRYTYLKSGQWIYIVCRWNLAGHPGDVPEPAEIYINADHDLYYTRNVPGHPFKENYLSAADILTETQVLHIGPAGISSELADKNRNWSADSTIDEFYFFPSNAEITKTAVTTTTTVEAVVRNQKGDVVDSSTTTSSSDSITETSGTQSTFDLAIDIYRQGRYYRPGSQESIFISQAINLDQLTGSAALYSSIPDPDGSAGAGIGLPLDETAEILGIAWTWYAEDTDQLTGQPILKNYKDYKNPKNIYPEIKVKFVEDDEEDPQQYINDEFSSVGLEVSTLSKVQYKLIFELPQIPLDALLLYTPVFDDITIYYTNGIEFLSYSYFD